MVYELYIVIGGIIFGLVGFLIGALLIHRAYKESPSINHYKKVIDILTLRKLHNRLYSSELIVDKKKSKTGEDHIEHYEGMRDKLTLRKKPQEVYSGGDGDGGSILGILPSLIGGFITIVIGVSLLPAISQQINQASMNVTSPSMEMTKTMLGIIPVFFVIAIVGIIIAVVSGALRSSGAL